MKTRLPAFTHANILNIWIKIWGDCVVANIAYCQHNFNRTWGPPPPATKRPSKS